jgi:cell fate regulator YaaT (PSP1 superfamily)
MIIRKASEQDLSHYDYIVSKAKRLYPDVLRTVRQMGLDMHIVRFEYTLDESKAIVNYVADQRVDFRQLLHVLADLLKTRIEMRQIGTRDRSKMVGGIGICGLPLCCATFLGEFEGISINMAKNQLLALNIQKLSGHCGKLLCCLKFEDDDYTQLRKGLPKVGLRITYNDKTYRIGSINVLSQMVRLDSPEDYQNITLNEALKLVEKTVKEQ